MESHKKLQTKYDRSKYTIPLEKIKEKNEQIMGTFPHGKIWLEVPGSDVDTMRYKSVILNDFSIDIIEKKFRYLCKIWKENLPNVENQVSEMNEMIKEMDLNKPENMNDTEREEYDAFYNMNIDKVEKLSDKSLQARGLHGYLQNRDFG